MLTLKNSSNSAKYLPLELTPSSWTQNRKKTGCCLSMFFSCDKRVIFYFFFCYLYGGWRELIDEIDSLHRLFTPKNCSKSYSIYLVGFVEKKRWKKAKILMEVEMTGSILSSKCTHTLLNLQSKNKNCVFGVKVSSSRTTNSWIRSRNGSFSADNHMISSAIWYK